MLYKTLIKPFFDFFIALLALLVLLPLFVFIMVALAMSNLGTPFFTQTRPGLHGKPFKVIKFKTMNDKRDKFGNILPDDVRLTGIGKFIRKTSLDEIPQLLNVLIGHMSLIGPRPLLMEYLGLYTVEQMRRHEVKPGITGWAQINGRNAISWQQKFAYDVWYVDNISFWLDVRIFFMTVLKVLKADGISGKGVATAEKFNGYN